jgi:glycosyltransferase involved in cell wall biosynthesis
MRILLVAQNFYPENFKSNDIAFELPNYGHKVDVLTGIPNYPEGRFYKGYGWFRKKKEKVNGVSITHVLLLPRGKGKVGLALNYLSFCFFASIRAFFVALINRYDCIIVQQTSPIIQVYPAVVIKKMQSIPLYIWVLDIWPDSMISGSGIHNKKIISAVDRLVSNIYRHCDKILISSRGFAELVTSKGVNADKLTYFPNWSDDFLNMPRIKIPELPTGFIVMIAGNLGGAQRLDSVMKVVLEVRDIEEVKWVLVGDGSKKKWVEEFIKDHHLENTVFTVGRFPFEAMSSFYSTADAMLLSLKAEFPHLKAVIPARLISYMSAARPVLAMADGAVADLINESDCGFAVPADDYNGLAEIIKNKILTDKKSFEKKGANGRRYFEKYFTKDACISHLNDILLQ